MRKLILLIIPLILLACGKEKMIDEAPSMVGVWVHYDATDAWEKVIIKEDGTGKVEWYTNNKLHKETKVKDWYVKGNELFLGKVTFSLRPYDINQYPLTSSATVVEGYDTLTSGSRYCILNNVNFVEKE